MTKNISIHAAYTLFFIRKGVKLPGCHRLAFSQGNQLLVRLRSQQHLFVIECRVIPIFRVYDPIFDSQIYQNTAESLILPGFFSGVFSFYYIVFFLNQIWMIDFYDFSRDCLLSFWISFIFLLVRNS